MHGLRGDHRAGNSQAVIERHYRGIIDEANAIDWGRIAQPAAPAAAQAPEDVTTMSVPEMLAMIQALTAEVSNRSGLGNTA